MADDRFTVELDLDTLQLKDKIKGVERTAKTSGAKIGQRLAAGIRRAPLRALNILTSKILAAGAALVTLFASRTILKAAARQEDAINNLNQSMVSAGRFSLEASQSFQEAAIELQKLTKVSDEEALELLGLANAFARTNEEAKALVKTSVDLAATGAITLDGAIKNLGKSFSGLTGELGEAFPVIRTLTVEQLKAGEAIKLLGDRFAGAAAAQVRTFQGVSEQTANELGRMAEELGFIVTKSPAVVEAIKKVKTAIENMTKSIINFGKENGFERIVVQMVRFGRVIVKFVVAPLELVVRIVDVLVKTIIAAIGGTLDLVGRATLTFIKSMNFVRGMGFQVSNDIQGFFDNMTNASADAFANLKESTTTLFEDGLGFSSKLDEGLVEIRSFVQEANASFKEIGFEASEDVAVNLEAISVKIASFSMTVLKMSSAVLQGLGAQLAKGGDTFKQFGKTALNILGDFAIQLGEMIIAAAIGIDALQKSLLSFGGAGLAIAAGIALIVVGGALKSFAGGPAGGGTAQAVTPVAPAGDTTGLPEIEQKQPVEIQLNIQGNVLDRRETGLEIVEVLREALAGNDGGSDLNLSFV